MYCAEPTFWFISNHPLAQYLLHLKTTDNPFGKYPEHGHYRPHGDLNGSG
jgi:hypothetical protein